MKTRKNSDPSISMTCCATGGGKLGRIMRYITWKFSRKAVEKVTRPEHEDQDTVVNKFDGYTGGQCVESPSKIYDILEMPVSNKFRYATQAKKLGRGSFGDVRVAVCKSSAEKVAIKRILKKSTSLADILDEVKVLHIIDHASIIQLIGVYSWRKNYYIVTELAEGESLYDHLKTFPPFSLDNAISIYAQLMSAVNHIHSIGVIHGDIKPSNIVIKNHQNRECILKLVDFGSAVPIENYRRKACTPAFCPPEVFDRFVISTTTAMDIWACGLITFILFEGGHPFCNKSSDNLDSLVSNILDKNVIFSDVWRVVSNSAACMIQQSLSKNPQLRPTALEMLQVRWEAWGSF